LGPRGWTSIRAVVHPLLPYSLQIPLKTGVDFYLDRFFGGPGWTSIRAWTAGPLLGGGVTQIRPKPLRVVAHRPQPKIHLYTSDPCPRRGRAGRVTLRCAADARGAERRASGGTSDARRGACPRDGGCCCGKIAGARFHDIVTPIERPPWAIGGPSFSTHRCGSLI